MVSLSQKGAFSMHIALKSHCFNSLILPRFPSKTDCSSFLPSVNDYGTGGQRISSIFPATIPTHYYYCYTTVAGLSCGQCGCELEIWSDIRKETFQISKEDEISKVIRVTTSVWRKRESMCLPTTWSAIETNIKWQQPVDTCAGHTNLWETGKN